MSNHHGPQDWTPKNVKIIPSLIVGAGGTGTKVVRHLKRRVRLDWPRVVNGELPKLIQFYTVDTVSYRNQPNEEFINPGEYGFLGGFDPHELSDPQHGHQSIREWWTFPPTMLPSGVVHLGARQVRALGRMSLFHAFPDVWQALSFKLDQLNSISASIQATERGYDIPVETSARQVFVVSSICGGTGAGCFLDLAARIRSREKTKVKIIGIFVLPSAFEHDLQSRRQRERVKANAYAALKEINAFWYGEHPFDVRYPGDTKGIALKHAVFDEIYLIGREGRGRSLSTLDDINQQIAHFIYLTSINNLADPVGERANNFDRVSAKFYSSFAVGALNLPETKLSDGLLAHLKRDYLRNLRRDRRYQDSEEALQRDMLQYLDRLNARARAESVDLVDAEQNDYNAKAVSLQRDIVLGLMRWLVETVFPQYGLGAVEMIAKECRNEQANLQQDIEQTLDEIKTAGGRSRLVRVLSRLGRFGEAITARLQSAEDYEEEVEKQRAELAVLRLLVPDPDNKSSGRRFLSFVTETLDQLEQQINQFFVRADELATQLDKDAINARNRQAQVLSPRGDGREARYYDMEIDPSVEGDGTPFAELWKSVLSYDKLKQYVAADTTLRPAQTPTMPEFIGPPAALQLVGFFATTSGTRPTDHLQTIVEVGELVSQESRLNMMTRQPWELSALLDELVSQSVEPTLRKVAGLDSFFNQPLLQHPARRQGMQASIKAVVKNLMNNVQPFWGARPFPDEQQLEKVHMLCMVQDPVRSEAAKELFREYMPPYQYVSGNSPYRMDALCIEHAAELRHISEIEACRRAYDTFMQQGRHSTLHLNPDYADLPDPLRPPPSGGHSGSTASTNGSTPLAVP